MLTVLSIALFDILRRHAISKPSKKHPVPVYFMPNCFHGPILDTLTIDKSAHVDGYVYENDIGRTVVIVGIGWLLENCPDYVSVTDIEQAAYVNYKPKQRPTKKTYYAARLAA